MKNCPKCSVDFSDDFSFCEFDGATLNRVIVEKQRSALLSRLYEKRQSVQLFGIAFFICMVAFIILAKANRKPTAVNQNQLAGLEQASLYVETPQAAQEYVEQGSASDSQNGETEISSETQTGKERDKNKEPDKPGVEVFLPPAKDAKHAKDSQQPPAAKPKSVEKAEPAEPQSEPANRRVRNEQANRHSPAAIPPPPTEQPQPNRSPRPQIATNRQIDDDEPLRQPSNRSVHMNLVRLRSYRTETGVRYDLTFNMQQQDGRVIRWERLNLFTRSSSGITHSEVIPFFQRLGSSGSLNFTVSVEMRGRAEADFQGRITCTGTGRDVEGQSIKTDFTARVHP
jgi:hypothetical protein